jgi:soluble lytic murein transglycosylase
MRLLVFIFMLLGSAVTADPDSVPDLTAAFAAADRGDWRTAEDLAQAAGGIGVDLVTWKRLREGEGSWEEARAFLGRHGDWPGTDPIRALAEREMPADLLPALALAWFDENGTETVDGVLKRAAALVAVGEESEAAMRVAEAWLSMDMTPGEEAVLLAAWGPELAQSHAGRLDWLLWRHRTTDAERLLDRVDEETAALAQARIGYLRREGGLPALVERVPEALRAGAAFRYARFDWLAGRGQWEEAAEMLAAASTSAEALGEPFRWSGHRRVLVRWLMREGDAELAYRLASNHFLSEGTAFSDLEWLAGYIALTRLDQPRVALLHFQTMERNVWTPISKSRGWYWIGRAQEALGDAAAAQAAYEEGGRHQTAFYGLLAAEKAGLPLDPELAGREAFPSFEAAGLDEVPLVQAGLHLLKAGERGLAVLFFAAMGETLAREQLGALGAFLEAWDEEFFEVLLGKSAANREIVLPAVYFPLHDLADMDMPVEPALALSIARRESEFRIDAGSSVGALGLMQLMPGTAQDVSGWIGEPYDRARLTRDWAYNARLGTAYLAYLEERFGGSPVLVSAGYNAGPGRPVSWVAERGDPRDPAVDLVDWIEQIPFEETRNYVMRVTESVPVYRARLSGETAPLAFTAYLRGEAGPVRPVARADGATVPVAASSRTASVPMESLLAPAVSLVPPSRPDRAVAGGIGAPARIGGPAPVRPVARPTGPGG